VATPHIAPKSTIITRRAHSIKANPEEEQEKRKKGEKGEIQEKQIQEGEKDEIRWVAHHS